MPRWAQQGSPKYHESVAGRYYAWVESGMLHGSLVTLPDADVAAAVNDLLKRCDHLLAEDESAWPPPRDLTQLADVIIVRPNGLGSGRLGPSADRLPLRDLITYARDELVRGQAAPDGP